MIVTVIGCGEAFDDRLPNTSLLVKTEAALMLFDCGFNVPGRVWRTEPDANAIDLIYLSHAHADHFFGLPGLLGRMWEEDRTKPIVLMGQQAVLDAADQAMTLGYRNLTRRFRFEIHRCPVENDRPYDILGCEFRFAETRHSSRNLAVRVEADGAAMCYSGDGALTDESRDLARGTGLWVQETFSFEPPESHADVGSVLKAAEEIEARRVALVHVNRGVRRERTRLFEAMLSAPVLCALPEPGSVFLL